MLGFTTDTNYGNEATDDNNEDSNTSKTTGNKIKIMLFKVFTITIRV